MRFLTLFLTFVLIIFAVLAKSKHAKKRIENCNTPKDDGSCLICNDGYVEYKNGCMQCPKNARVCTTDNVIIECFKLYSLSENGKNCVPDPN